MLYSYRRVVSGPHAAVQAVDELLSVLCVSGEAQVPIPSWHYQVPDTDGAPNVMRLQDALIQCYDIRCDASHSLSQMQKTCLTSRFVTALNRPIRFDPSNQCQVSRTENFLVSRVLELGLMPHTQEPRT